jgi:adenosylmethionine-8-amino-7-oxononanoate aminotransferase
MAIETSVHADLQRKAKDHLWLHFSSMGSYRDGEIPIIERGEGPYLFDTRGKRYLDMLSGLFTVQIGYSYGDELGQAALEQMRQLPYYTNWTFAHPPAAELAARLAGLAPPGINRAFFVSGGSEAVESAWKLARQYHAANGQPMRRKVIARKVAYHGATMGALSITGITSIRTPFEPLVDGVRHVANTNRYRCKYCAEAGECTLACADEVAETIEQEGPETVAMVIMEPVQNSGGTFTPHPDYHRRVREICDTYGVLQVADEVICGFGRLGEWFGCQRYGYEPDLITCAKGLTSGYASLGALLISDRVAEPFLERGEYYLHGITFGGHPLATAIAGANLDILERLDLLANVRANEAYFSEQLHGLAGDHDVIGDVRGAGYFMSLELVKDRATRQTFSPEECQVLLREFLSPELQEAGVICRADDRGDPVLQLSPPLICTREHIDEAVRALDSVLPRAQKLMRGES